jgi:hypothetical protein
MVRVPEAFTVPQPPVKGMLKLNEPLAVGVPLIVIVLFNQDALTPAGKFVGAPIPVAPVVVIVKFEGSGSLMHADVESEVAVFRELTRIYRLTPAA